MEIGTPALQKVLPNGGQHISWKATCVRCDQMPVICLPQNCVYDSLSCMLPSTLTIANDASGSKFAADNHYVRLSCLRAAG